MSDSKEKTAKPLTFDSPSNLNIRVTTESFVPKFPEIKSGNKESNTKKGK